MSEEEDVKIISRETVFEGWHQLELIELEHRSRKNPDRMVPMSREMYYCGTIVVGLLYQPETDQILLNEQFRVGAYIAGELNPWLLECCAGRIDDGEAPEDALRREAAEETGCTITDIEFVSKLYPSPGGTDEVFMLYCGRIGETTTGHFGLEEEGEEISTFLVKADDAIRMLDEGKITNGATVTLLHWFARHRDRLRKKWA